MKPPIPPWNLPNLQGAIGDLMRVAFAWGAADAKNEATEAHITMLAQSAAQLLALALQRDPTADEIAGVIGG